MKEIASAISFIFSIALSEMLCYNVIDKKGIEG